MRSLFVKPVEGPLVDDSLPLPLIVLARFRRLMFVQGWTVDLARLCIDPTYLHECLARAHHGSSEQLRRVAMLLFAGGAVRPATAFAH